MPHLGCCNSPRSASGGGGIILGHSNKDNIYLMHIHLSDRHWCQPFSSTSLCLRRKYSKFVLFFFWAVSRRFGSCLFEFTRPFRVTLIGVSGSAVSCQFKFLDARNLTCLQPLPNPLYTKYYIKHIVVFGQFEHRTKINRVAFCELLLSL